MPKGRNKGHLANAQRTLLRTLVQTIIANRPNIYATPDLAEVNNNGGDRINKKIQQILKKMLEANGVADASGMIQEEVARLGRSKKVVGGTPSPRKTPAKGKKRKLKVELDEGREEGEEMEELEELEEGEVKHEPA